MGVLVIVAGAFCLLYRERILFSMGAALDASEPPRRADMAVALSGAPYGGRLLTAAELVRQGFAKKALVSCASVFYGHAECELAIDFAVARGYPREYFIPFQRPNHSTAEEARTEVPELRRLGVRRYLLVTNAWHTARAIRLFRRAGPELEGHAIAAPDAIWRNGRWWTDREARKEWALEALKTVAGYVGF